MEGARRVPGWTPVDFFILRHGQTTWNARGIIQGQADAPLDDVGRAQARALAEFLVGDGLSAGRTRGFPRPGLPVVTSDLSRAVDTARILADALVRAEDDARPLRVPSDPSAEPEPLHQTPKLRERHVGRLQGLKRADAKASDPVAWRAFRSRDDSQRIPGEKGESYDNLWDRAVGLVEARAAAAAAAAAAAVVPADASRLAAGPEASASASRGRARAPIALVTHGGVARVLLDRCARDEAALRRAFEGVQSGGVPYRVETENLTTRTDGGGVARRPGVVPNCSVGVIRVHVPPDSAAELEQMWEAVVWGEDAFLSAAGKGAESAAGEDYA